jgi:hypothetical protein
MLEMFFSLNTLTYMASLRSCNVGNVWCRPSKHAVVIGYASVYGYAAGTIYVCSKAQFFSYAYPLIFSFSLVKDATCISHGREARAQTTAFLVYTSNATN